MHFKERKKVLKKCFDLGVMTHRNKDLDLNLEKNPKQNFQLRPAHSEYSWTTMLSPTPLFQRFKTSFELHSHSRELQKCFKVF